MQRIQRRYSIGLPFLDRRLGGGVSVGTVVSLLAPPASQGQLLLRAVTQERPVVYFSTSSQSEEQLATWLAASHHRRESVTVKYTPPDTLLGDVRDVLQIAPSESFLVFDTINPLERASRDEFLAFLHDVKQWVTAHDSIAFFHCLNTARTPPLRPVTLNWADQIWWLQTQLLSKDIANRLYITKARTDRALEEPIPLVLTDQVRVDTSRNI